MADPIDQLLDLYTPTPEEQKAAAPVPVPDSLIQRFLSYRNPTDKHIDERVGNAMDEAWGSEPLGMTPDTIKQFQDMGVFNKPGEASNLKFLAENVAGYAETGGEAVLRGINAGIAGFVESVGENAKALVKPVVGKNIAENVGEGGKELLDYWITVDSMARGGEMYRPGVTPHGEAVQENLGTVPRTNQSFTDAAKALGDKDLQDTVKQLYHDKGVLPAEAVHDSYYDPTILQDLAKGDVPKAYGGQFPIDLKQQVEQFQEKKKILATNEVYPEAQPPYHYTPLDVSKNLEGTTLYHGTKSALEKLSDYDVYQYSDPHNLYGEGLYLTDMPQMAARYAKNKGEGPQGKILAAKIGNVNLIDLDKPLPDKVWPVYEKELKEHFDFEGEEGANKLAELKASPGKEVYAEIKDGMRDSGYFSSDAIDVWSGINHKLSDLGFDGLRHTGGEFIKTKLGPHNVVILFENSMISKAGQEAGRALRDKLKDVPYTPEKPTTVSATSMGGEFVQEALPNTPITHTADGTAIQMPGGTWSMADKDFKISYIGNSPAAKRMSELVKGQAPGSEDFPHLNEGGGSGGEPPKVGRRDGNPQLPGPKGGLPAIPDKEVPLSKKTISQLQSEILSNVSIGKTDWKDPMTLDRLYYNVFDDIHPVAVAQARAVKDIKLRQGEDYNWEEHGGTNAYEDFRLTRGSFGRADQMMKYGTFDFHTYANNGRGFEQIIEPFKKDLNGLRAYMVSKRAIELDNRGIETGFNIEAAKRLVNDHVEKALYETTQKELVDYHNKLAQYLRDSGTISHRLYDSIVEANKNFVPFNRYLDSSLHPITGTKYAVGRRLGSKNPLKTIKGSDLMIIDPLESIIKNTYHYVALAEKNAAGRKLVDLLKEADKGISSTTQVETNPDWLKKQMDLGKKGPALEDHSEDITVSPTAEATGKVLEGEILPPEKAATADAKSNQYITEQWDEGTTGTEVGFPRRELEEIAEDGVKDETSDFIDALWETTAPEVGDGTVQVHGKARAQVGDTISVFENGKKVTYRVRDADLLRAWRGLDQYTANWAIRVLSGPASLLRAGATITPEFITKNLFRDFLSAFINTGDALFHPGNTIMGAIEYGNKGEVYQNWLKGGGANGTMVSLDRKYLQESLLQLNKNTGFLKGVWNTVRPIDAKNFIPWQWSMNPKFGGLKPFQMMRTASEYAENATRLGAYMKIAGKTANKGLIKQGAYASREATLDFARIGASMRGMNLITAFFSPSLQGVDRLVRAFKKNPLGTALRVSLGITAPSVLLWQHNVTDPRWKDIPVYQKNLFWMYLTPDGGPIIRIPKPFEAGIIFGSGPERALDYMWAHDRHAFDGFFRDAGESLTPSVVPTFATPLMEQAGNYSMFTGEPLIPSRLENILPEYQYQSYTSETAKTISKFFSAIPGMRTAALNGNPAANTFSSPIILENYIKDWTGGTGQYLLNVADSALRNAGVVPKPVNPTEKSWSDILFVRSFLVRYPSASTRSIEDFYSRNAANEKVMNTLQEAANGGNLKATDEIQKNYGIRVDLDGIKQALTDQAHLVSSIDQNPTIPSHEKRQQIDSIYSNMIKLATSGVTILDKLDDARNGNR